MNKIIIILVILYLIWYSYLSINIWDKSFTKYKILDYLPDNHPNKLSHTLFKKCYNTKLLYNVKLPKIFKSNECTTYNKDVFLIENSTDLNNFLDNYKKEKFDFIIQEPCFDSNEYTICYLKTPLKKEPDVFHLTKRIMNNKPCGKFCITHPRSHKIYTIKIPKNFKNNIKQICSFVPNLYCTRFDIKAKNLKHLFDNKFKVLEINGSFSQMFIGDPIKCGISYLLKILLGLMHILTLKAHNPVKMLDIMSASFKTLGKCGTHHVLSPSPV